MAAGPDPELRQPPRPPARSCLQLCHALAGRWRGIAVVPWFLSPILRGSPRGGSGCPGQPPAGTRAGGGAEGSLPAQGTLQRGAGEGLSAAELFQEAGELAEGSWAGVAFSRAEPVEPGGVSVPGAVGVRWRAGFSCKQAHERKDNSSGFSTTQLRRGAEPGAAPGCPWGHHCFIKLLPGTEALGAEVRTGVPNPVVEAGVAAVQSSPGVVGLTFHQGQKLELISNSLLIEGSSPTAAPHPMSCPARASGGAGSFAMGDAEEHLVPSARHHPLRQLNPVNAPSGGRKNTAR